MKTTKSYRLALALLLAASATLAGCDKNGGGGGVTQPKLPINSTPAQFTRNYFPLLSSWSFSVAVTTTTEFGSPATKYAIWYYHNNNSYQQGGASFESLSVSSSTGTDPIDHGETWRVDDNGLTADFGGSVEAQLMAFPLTVGKTWTGTHAYQFGHPFTTRFTCSGIDNIQTNRGLLYTFRVSFHNERQGRVYSRNYTDTSDGTFWIAPDYGVVKVSATQFWGETNVTRVTQAEIT